MGVEIRPSGLKFLRVLAEERLERWYVLEGKTIKRIAEEIGCSIGTVDRLLRLHDIRRLNR